MVRKTHGGNVTNTRGFRAASGRVSTYIGVVWPTRTTHEARVSDYQQVRWRGAACALW